jgi:microcystin-dependent protein
MLGRVLGAAGAGQGLSNRPLGYALGEESHTQTLAEMPNHAHNTWYSQSDAGGGATIDVVVGPGGIPLPTSAEGGGQPFNVMQPTTFVNCMIKL